MNLFDKALCFFGFHVWTEIPEDPFAEKYMPHTSQIVYRNCDVCGKKKLKFLKYSFIQLSDITSKYHGQEVGLVEDVVRLQMHGYINEKGEEVCSSGGGFMHIRQHNVNQ